MDGIEADSSFLDWQQLERYLGQVAPVEFDAHYFTFATKISEWVRRHSLPVLTVTLTVETPETKRQVFKPYRTHYRTQRKGYEFNIKDVCFYPESPSSDTPFWLWYGKTDMLGMVGDERVAGLRLRKQNIALGGPERVGELFTEVAESYGRFNAYYVGEIHVVTPEAIPNARRDGFEHAGVWPQIREELKPFIRTLCKEAYERSKDSNLSITRVVGAAEKVIEEAEKQLAIGFVSTEERTDLLEQIRHEEERATRALEKRKDAPDTTEITTVATKLKDIRESLERENHFAVQKLRSSLDRKQRKIIAEVLQVLHATLDEASFKKAKTAILARFQVSDNGTK